MGRWLDAYVAESADTTSPEKKTENGPYGVPTKLTKPSEPRPGDGSVGFVSPSAAFFEKNSPDPPQYPLF
jgi:hypothetical protein